jgi:predicted nucleotidyltransferase component of viral defense system
MEHKMKLHENSKLYEQAVRATAQQMELLDIYVEKDYWVTYVLQTIFNHEIGKQVVFKGGTALSKCHGIIERFSEDIDLVVFRREDESNNQLTNKIKLVSKVVCEAIPEIEIKEVTQKMGMNRKTAHSYTQLFKGNFGQVRDVIIVEASWLGHFEPYTSKEVRSYIYDMMIKSGQHQMANEYGLLPFPVLVLDMRRTLCEKIMSLIRFSYTSQAIEDLKNKVRHTYDIHKLLQVPGNMSFFDSEDFYKMLLKVAQDDMASYKNDNAWLLYHPNKSIIFGDTHNTWNKIKEIYSGQFRNLVYGSLPDEADIYKSLQKVADRLENMEWTIDLKVGT